MIRRLTNCANGHKHALIFFFFLSHSQQIHIVFFFFFMVNELENAFMTKVKGTFKSEAKAWQFLEILKVKLGTLCWSRTLKHIFFLNNRIWNCDR